MDVGVFARSQTRALRPDRLGRRHDVHAVRTRRTLKALRYCLPSAMRVTHEDAAEYEGSEKHGVANDEFLDDLRRSDCL